MEVFMTIKEAIETAMQYEQRIRDLYGDAARQTSNPEGKRFFQMLSDDEQSHFDYLTDRLSQWEKAGVLEVIPLKSTVPSVKDLEKEVTSVGKKLSEEDRGDLKQALSKALKSEVETSEFYRKLVRELSGDAREMFNEFLTIEENHVAAVEAEMNYLNKSGYFFDIREFDLEG